MRNANIDIKTFMENREYQILSEIREMISSVRAQLDALEAKVALLSQDAVTEVVDDTPIDLDIVDVFDDFPVVESLAESVTEPVAESVEYSVEEVTIEEVAEVFINEVVPEPIAEVLEAPVEDGLPLVAEESDDDLPFVDEEDLPANEEVLLVAEEEKEDIPVGEMLIDAAVANARPTVIDAMTAKQAWRTDIPGSPVKDIRSAISLHDRIIFINGLFDEDPMLFQEVLTAINSMSSVDDVVAYLAEKRPEWDMNSDEVYRFMMAVRRRIQ